MYGINGSGTSPIDMTYSKSTSNTQGRDWYITKTSIIKILFLKIRPISWQIIHGGLGGLWTDMRLGQPHTKCSIWSKQVYE